MRGATFILAAALSAISSLALAAENRFVKPLLLLDYKKGDLFYDYRAAINAAGTRVVFERSTTVTGNEQPGSNGYSPVVNLYLVDVQHRRATPEPLIAGNAIPSNRPDWCWSSSNPVREDSIAFSSADGIYHTERHAQPGGNYKLLAGTSNQFIYPTWYPGCDALAIYMYGAIKYGPGPVINNETYQNPGPATKLFNFGKSAGLAAGYLSGSKMWVGFPSVNSTDPTLLVVAGQKFVPQGYNQNTNYIFVLNTMASPPYLKPLEHDAPVNNYSPLYQGRAPTWSPDGQWIAFESNRNCSDKGFYSIFVIDAKGRQPPRQTTNCKYNAQHAKWYSQPQNGRTLMVVSVRLYPNYFGDDPQQFNARGIAQLDVTDFLTP